MHLQPGNGHKRTRLEPGVSFTTGAVVGWRGFLLLFRRQRGTRPAALNALPVDIAELIGFALHLAKVLQNETPRFAGGASGSPPPEPPDIAKSKGIVIQCPQICSNHADIFSTRLLITQLRIRS